jgi:pseudouridine synthase
VSALPARLYPVGRLDIDTEGALLMTNDGTLCYRMTHPRFGIEKTYHADVAGRPPQKVIKKLRQGVKMEDGKTWPAEVRLIASNPDRSTLEITVHEGRKRQIKRMCKAVGHRVLKLRRVEFGGIGLGNLKPGQYRLLSDNEVAKLRKKALTV